MSIQSIGVSIENWDPLLTFILSSKLDQSTIVHYECQLTDVREPQSLNDLTYIEGRFMALQSAAFKSDTTTNKKFNDNKMKKNVDKEKHFQKQFNCIFCSESHSIRQRTKFEKKSPNERLNWARSESLYELLRYT